MHESYEARVFFSYMVHANWLNKKRLCPEVILSGWKSKASSTT